MSLVAAYIAERLPLLSRRIDPGRLVEETRVLLKSQLGWDDACITQEKDGVTNLLLKCTHGTESVLVRVYGDATDTIISRTRELENFVALHLQGYAPEVLCRFQNGLLYRFMPGQVLSSATVGRPENMQATASLLGEWHRVMPHDDANAFWPILEEWIDLVPADAPQSRDWLKNTYKTVKAEALAASNELVFSHNDLLPANIIVQENNKVAFIDYEYSCTHDPHFDIANHFLEYAGFECDWTVLPTEEQQRIFVMHYLKAFHGRESDDAELAAVTRRIHAYMRVSHF
jgi:ethanolamine kinase